MKKSSTYFGFVAIAALLFSGCSAIQSVTSEAYALGLATGQEYAGLKETADNLQSWIPDEDGAESFSSSQITEDGVRQYCTTIWFAVGITSGLENSDANENDFVAGCLDGAGY
jgi:uncharacterized protein YceK